ncbi:hypothetical protein GW626_04335 [Peribacillus muralis]|uniref:hypothetical protein n=1 Tax=Peribacillus muralis TaxID=264697 RepID=UPI001F4EDF57|nr:hypothetical protein [Peribacillus muralis]MCK1993145.1 hypothetical protein [Peribacillus muralis]MCK2013699.1 hypothetical protein [Peribacillus muralis]
MDDKHLKNEIKKPSVDRAGLRTFMGNPENFELSWYGILMACAPIILFSAFVWWQW